jgi:tripeptidyl-peptidase-1
VNAWLNANELEATTLSPAGEWIRITVPVSKANSLFDANYQTFTHTDTGKWGLRTLSYSLPASLKGSIEGIHPATSFDFGTVNVPMLQVHETRALKRNESTEIKAKRALSSSCHSEMSPTCLQQLYGIPTTPATQGSNAIGVSGFDNEFAQVEDLVVSVKLQPTRYVGC